MALHGLRITRVAVYRACLPLLGGRYRWGDGKYGTRSIRPLSALRRTSPALLDMARTAHSERTTLPMFPAGTRAGIVELAPHLLGEDPTKLGVLNSRMDWSAGGEERDRHALLRYPGEGRTRRC